MENELTCCVCLELFSQPLMLPCCHNFCRKCLEDLYRHSASVPPEDDVGPGLRRGSARLRVLSCPKCRGEVTLDSWKGVSSLPENKVLENIVSLFTSHSSSPELFPKCRYHDEKRMYYYCLTCKKSLCEVCASEQHSGFSHHVELLQDLIAKEEEGLAACVQEFEAVGNRIKLHQDEVSGLLTDIDAKKTLAHSLVKEHMASISSSLHVQKMKLSEEIDWDNSVLTRPLITLRDKYCSLNAELLVLKNCHKEVLKEKNIAWKLKRLQDLSLRCSTFLTFRAGNIPNPPNPAPCGHIGDVEIRGVLKAIRQLKFAKNNTHKAVAVHSVSTQTGDSKVENFSEKDNNMNVGDQNGADGPPLPTTSQNGKECLSLVPNQSKTGDLSFPSANGINGHAKSDQSSTAQASVDGFSDVYKDEDLGGAVGGTSERCAPPTNQDDNPFETAQKRLKHLSLGPRTGSTGGLSSARSRSESPSGSKKLSGGPSGPKYVFGSAQNSFWPTNLSKTKFFGFDSAVGEKSLRSSGENGKTAVPDSTDQSKLNQDEKGAQKLGSDTHGSRPSIPMIDANGEKNPKKKSSFNAVDKSRDKHVGIEQGKGNENIQPWPAFPLQNSHIDSTMHPSLQRASSEPSTTVVDSAGQFCGIGARPKIRSMQNHSSVSADDKKMATSFKEGLNSAMCTLKSLCGVGMNGSGTDTPGRSSLVWSTGDISQSPRVWPSTSASQTNRDRTNKPTSTSLNSPPLLNRTSSKALSETKLGPIDNDLFKKPHGHSSFELESSRSLNGNSDSEPTPSKGSKGKAPPLQGSASNIGLLGGGASSSVGDQSDFWPSFCDNTTPKPPSQGTASESDPEMFSTPDESFGSKDESPLFTSPTFHIGASSPVTRPKVKRHMKKRR